MTIPPLQHANSVTTSLPLAIEHHHAGRLHEAREIYLAILKIHPDHPEANHNLGVLAMQAKQAHAALPHFIAALNAAPASRQYWLSYIDALLHAGQTEEAGQILTLARQQGLEGEEVEALAARIQPAATTGIPMATTGKSKPEKMGKRRAPAQQEINALVALFADGRLTEAANQARSLTVKFPQHGMGWKALGAACMQMGMPSNALIPMQKAATLLPNDAEAHNNLGIALYESGRLTEACDSYRRSIQINPGNPGTHSNLGAALHKSGQLDAAQACYRQALRIDPNYVRALSNLGAILLESNHLDEALGYLKQAVRIQTGNAQSHYNLSITLKELGQLAHALESCQQAIEIDPNYADAHFHLGNILYELNQLDQAEAAYRQSLQIRPDFTDALNNLALLLNAQGKSEMALKLIQQSLKIRETPVAKSHFVDCVKNLRFTHDDIDVRASLIRALSEPWGRTSELARVCTDWVKQDIAPLVTRVSRAWPMRLTDLFDPDCLSTLATNTLLCTLLESAPICNVEMERFMTAARQAMLDIAIDQTDEQTGEYLRFFGAVAQQCFINEYVFTYTADEIEKAGKLRDRLIASQQENTRLPASWLLAVASYFPLHALPCAAKLLEDRWPEAVQAVLKQQIQEPVEENQLRATIPRLNEVENEVSLLVQNQYEENPYPRWVRTASAGEPKSIVGYLCQKFPLSNIQRKPDRDITEVLIAGCGTGQHSTGAAQRIKGASMLAVDLSMSSLAYAKRKTIEMDLNSIEYAQADLLKLCTMDRSFDVIESSGVLHHLADPWAGWRVLLSRLRPGGFMKIGLYSEVARKNIVRIRNVIADQGWGATVEEIRHYRQQLMDSDENMEFSDILNSPDFFSISACRDLLFHVQEHRMTLTGIDAFLSEHNLTFLGFEIERETLHAYKLRFPDDHAATNLGQWQIFENENPDTFANMYQMWLQKRD
jgi:tetratricopeptide (TPR) repeat protein/SAM-dependent methyltransferase